MQARVNLVGIPPRITQPIYILHGALDILIPVAQAQRAEAMSDPAKSLAGGMRHVRVGTGCLHDFSQ